MHPADGLSFRLLPCVTASQQAHNRIRIQHVKGLRPDKQTGRRLKARRLELGLSQRELASKTVSYAYISRVEAGQRVPSWSTLIDLDRLDTTALQLGLGRGHDCPVCSR